MHVMLTLNDKTLCFHKHLKHLYHYGNDILKVTFSAHTRKRMAKSYKIDIQDASSLLSANRTLNTIRLTNEEHKLHEVIQNKPYITMTTIYHIATVRLPWRHRCSVYQSGNQTLYILYITCLISAFLGLLCSDGI